MKWNFKCAIFVILLVFLFANLLACGGRRSNVNQTHESHFNADTVNLVLSPIVKRIIGEYRNYLRDIGYKDTDSTTYDIHIYQSKDGPKLEIGEVWYYDENFIVGYTYWNGDVIAYHEYDSTLNLGFIDKDRLIPFVDTIPRFRNILFIDEQIDPVIQGYLIHGPDSLELVYSGLS